MEGLPTYKITIDEEYNDGVEPLGVDAIAFTCSPAVMVKGVAFSSQRKLSFTDGKKYRITAPAMIPMEIYRRDKGGEYYVEFTEQEIEVIFKDFMANLENKNLFNLEHDNDEKVPAYILEAWLVDKPREDKAYSTFGIDVPKGTLMVTAQVTDVDYYENLIKDEVTGFSIEGFLGLKLSNQINHNMSNLKKKTTSKKSFSTKKRFSGKKKYAEEGEVVEGGEVTVVAEEISQGQDVVVVDDNLEVVEDYTGDIIINNEVVTIEEGTITEVAPEGETTEEVEMAEEEKVEEVEMADEVKEEEKEEMAVDPAMDSEAILAIVAPMLEEKIAEVLQVIADLKNELSESVEDAPTEEVELQLSAHQRFSNIVKFLK
jgi:hypothetical protein